MPSRADDGGRVRLGLERGARALAIAIVVWLLVDSLRGSRETAADVVRAAELPEALRRWSTVAAPAQVHLHLDSTLAPASRDWLAALPPTGTAVGWDGDGALPIAAMAEPVADPAGGTRIWAAAPRGATVVLHDDFGVRDSATAGAAGARFLVRSTLGAARIKAGATAARVAPRDSLTLGRVLLLGRVGWEGKFVAAALEERGWAVDARLTLSPKGQVLQNAGAPIDTARYAAVIVLDGAAPAGAAEVARYVRDGGGLIVAARASDAPMLAALRGGRAGTPMEAVEPFDSAAAEPRRALALVPIVPRADAVVLERRGAHVAVAARRIERGRVTTLGYEDTWRWRMGGNAAALDEHRAWWAALVAGVAHTGRMPLARSATLDEAPLVSLFDRLGPSSAPPPVASAAARIPNAWLLGLFCLALLGEWLSRRLRGAP